MSASEAPPVSPPFESGAQRPAAQSAPHPVKRGARWAAELATVFVSVYAAFLFNNYQAHRQERERREQILAWLEETCVTDLADTKSERAVIQKKADEFNRQVKAGEMPPLHAFTWLSSYDPSDVASLLASGGFDLLEVQTVRDMKNVESTVRMMVSYVRHDQQLSDTYLLPNLEKDHVFFYDPATKELRPGYAWYQDFFEAIPKAYAHLEPQLEKLLQQIRAERSRNR